MSNNCPECKKTSSIQDMYYAICKLLKSIKDAGDNASTATNYTVAEIGQVNTGDEETYLADTIHSITITVIEECDSISVGSSVISDVPAGYSCTYTADTLLSSEIVIDCSTKGKAIVNILN